MSVWGSERKIWQNDWEEGGFLGLSGADIIKSNRRLIADPKVPAKARILRQKCHLRQISVNCDKCDNLHQNSTICIKTALFA